MHISVVDPIGPAIRRTRDVLFRPFDPTKWFVLGFCAFLANLGDLGGGGYNRWSEWREEAEESNGRVTVSAGASREHAAEDGGAPAKNKALIWVHDNLSWLIAGGLALTGGIVAILALVNWLRSRGQFLFLDGIVRNRGAVVEPWQTYSQLGNSLFGFLLFLITLGTLAVGLALSAGVVIAWPDIQAERFQASAIAALIVPGVLIGLMVVAFWLIGLLLHNFVVPTMYLRNERVMDAWVTARQELWQDRLGAIVRFFLMKLVFYVILGIMVSTSLIVTCCCLTALPYIGTVIMLPLIVFERCYTLGFLEQFGPNWRFFTSDAYPSD